VPIDAGPCTWPDLTQLCCPDWDDVNPDLQIQSLDYAKTVVWAATGRQFGLCEMVVRPCGRQCNDCPSGWAYDGYGSWQPYVWNGVWKNCVCGGLACSCDPACQVYLPGPVHSITSVQLGGETLPATGAYFVLDQQWLVRSDTTACWPLCADQNLQPGDPNVFEVTYLRGREVPVALAQATSTLACEYAKACMGQVCRLPSRVASIARQGVTISMVDIAEILKNGLTGLWELDQLIMAYNPYGMKGRTRFYSPDLQEPRQVTWP
jgi:hypothetical protein